MTKVEQLKYLDELYAQIERNEASITEYNVSSINGHAETELKIRNVSLNKITITNTGTISFGPISFGSGSTSSDQRFYRADPQQYTANTTQYATSPFNTITGISS